VDAAAAHGAVEPAGAVDADVGVGRVDGREDLAVPADVDPVRALERGVDGKAREGGGLAVFDDGDRGRFVQVPEPATHVHPAGDVDLERDASLDDEAGASAHVEVSVDEEPDPAAVPRRGGGPERD